MPVQTRWLLPPSDPREAETLAGALGVSLPAARVLWNRGYRDASSAGRFLRPSLADLHDPYLLKGMPEAVARLRRAVLEGEKILLYGDYDVDGAASIVILKKALELAGGQASYHVPNRLRDGYGMRVEVIEQAARDGVTLIVSADTGIRASEAVRRAADLSIDVIVTDHHLPEAELPPALAVLNPNRRDCSYPHKSLCGAGVAFKLVEALCATLDWPPRKLDRVKESFLKLVAIATVADVVPLTGENRVIVKRGLEGLRSVRNAGLRALLDVAGFAEGSRPSAGQVAYRIAPRMNAAGRMANAADVIDLFLTEDAGRARELAAQLHALNQERQQAESGIVQRILEECSRVPVTDAQAVLVFHGADWHRGVVGIVASRLVERFHRPVIVLSEDAESGLAQGSGRSVPAFHLLEALESMPELLTRFGGHSHAVGLSLPITRVEEFQERLQVWAAARLGPADFQPVLELDATLDLREVTDRAVEEILSLAPFGAGNPAPLFAVEGLEVCAQPVVWKERNLRLVVRQNGRTLTLKAWNFAQRATEVALESRIDAALTFEEDPYAAGRGYAGWAAVLRDVRPARL